MIYAKKIAELKAKLGPARFALVTARIDKNAPLSMSKTVAALEAELANPSPAASAPVTTAPKPAPAAAAPAPSRPVSAPAKPAAQTKPSENKAGEYDPTKPRTSLLQDSRLPKNHPWHDPQ